MTYNDLQKAFVENTKSVFIERESLAVFWIVVFHLNQWSRIQFEMNKSKPVEPDKEAAFRAVENRLKRGEPVQYIFEGTEFYGKHHIVSPSVLIPRPETEELVDWIISDLKSKTRQKVLDVGTGSGCIINSLALHLKGEFLGVDISDEALIIAERNAKKLKTGVMFQQLDILKSTQKGFNCDVIVSNPPYIPVKDRLEMKSNVLDFEPGLALFVSNDDPLVFYEAIIKFSFKNLRKNGALYFEIHEGHVNEIKLLVDGLNCNYRLKKDMQGKFRMLKIWDLV